MDFLELEHSRIFSSTRVLQFTSGASSGWISVHLYWAELANERLRSRTRAGKLHFRTIEWLELEQNSSKKCSSSSFSSARARTRKTSGSGFFVRIFPAATRDALRTRRYWLVLVIETLRSGSGRAYAPPDIAESRNRARALEIMRRCGFKILIIGGLLPKGSGHSRSLGTGWAMCSPSPLWIGAEFGASECRGSLVHEWGILYPMGAVKNLLARPFGQCSSVEFGFWVPLACP